MEKVARAQYLERRDPKESALLYLTLGRPAVLAGLLKLSHDEKDRKLMTFLSQNFKEERARSAALKNAYVLLGQHKFQLAAAFFVLAGDVLSAAQICCKNMGDPQMGLVICRLAETPESRHVAALVAETLLPAARQRGDMWQASLLQWLLGKQMPSLRTLLPPLPPPETQPHHHSAASSFSTSDSNSRSFQAAESGSRGGGGGGGGEWGGGERQLADVELGAYVELAAGKMRVEGAARAALTGLRARAAL
eukprot:jgi/Mesen1/1227/ME000129S00328